MVFCFLFLFLKCAPTATRKLRKSKEFLTDLIVWKKERMKKVLVTGASGYLGGRLCHALLRQGHSVRAFVRPTSDLSSLPPPSSDGGTFELAYGDATDYPSLLAACSGCHVIFHAAALVEPWLPDPSKLSSVISTANLNFAPKIKFNLIVCFGSDFGF